MTERWRQLPLPFTHEPRFGAADLIEAPSNGEAMAWLASGAAWPQGRLVLWGPEGCGKTHLLHVWAARAGALVLPGGALPREPDRPERPAAIDDADTAAEHPLLHLLNAHAEAGRPVLLASRAAPARWAIGLPDLASRLRAAIAVEIRPPEESLLRALLARLLYERQLAVQEPIQDWLLLRLPRTPAAMREVAARLDRAALGTGGRVTRAVAAEVARTMAEWDQPAREFSAIREDLAPTASTPYTSTPWLL
jgi:chromosomal replication initiation ATPase DnaA